MLTTKIAGAVAALALLTAPSVAAAHDGHHHEGRHHHHQHHAKKAKVREVTGAATATVASFTNDELTLTLPSGRTFTATVGRKTVIRCFTAAPTTATTARHGGDDDNNSGPGNSGDDNDDNGPGNAGDRHDDGPNHDVNDDNGVDPANHDANDDNGVDPPNHDANDDNGVDPPNHDNGQGPVNGNGPCGTAALVAGAKVAFAKLSLAGGDATWTKVVIVK
jgi:hypothetical protein